jgi:hypothetical protein
MDRKCKGDNPVTARVDRETVESLDQDADRLGDFRADRMRDALGLYLDLRRGDFECPHCEQSITVEP